MARLAVGCPSSRDIFASGKMMCDFTEWLRHSQKLDAAKPTLPSDDLGSNAIIAP